MLGAFGSADIFFEKDWKDVKDDESFAKLGTATWDSSTNTCKVFTTAVVKVVYYSAGYNDLPQKYVIEVTKSAIEESFAAPIRTGETVDINSHVSVQFVKYNY